ncbi:MAG: hypothetical protein O3A95_02355 [Planctomycetota bacterium]|nr:hypothetical protein [Planctomycetota bacterium]MDA1113126.1 hypothetical protein [Planctomycetota bacterium]
MNKLLQTFLIFVTGILGGLVGSTLLSTSDSEATSGAETTAATEVGADFGKQLDSLQMQFDNMERQLEVQGGTILSMKDRVSSAVEMDRALRDGRLPDGEEFPLASNSIPTGQGFDAAVGAVIQQREEQEDAERDVRREERRKEQLETRIAELSEQLGLDSSQTEVLSKALNDSSVARNEFFADMRENGWGDREGIRTRMTEISEQETNALSASLSPEQMTQYAESNDSSGFGGFGGGNRGGNRGGTTGGGTTGGTGGGNRGGGF